MTAGEKLKAWRDWAETTQRKAAKAAGFSQAAWNDYENDHKEPRVDQIRKLEELTRGSPHHVTMDDFGTAPPVRRPRRRPSAAPAG